MRKFLTYVAFICTALYIIFQYCMPISITTLLNKDDKKAAEPVITSGVVQDNQFVPLDEEDMESCSSYENWLEIMDSTVYTLKDTVTINIKNYSDKTYDIEKLPYQISMKAEKRPGLGTTNLKYTFDYDSNFKIIATAVNIDNYQYLNDAEKAAFDVLKAEAERINSQTDMEYNREVAIHNYITKNYRYSETGTEAERTHTIVGLIEDKSGVCQAYADAFEAMCRLCGLDVRGVNGEFNGASHGWNVVKIGGMWYHVDVTGDDPVPDNMLVQHYDFFNLNDKEIAKTHTLESKGVPECTATTYNYFIANNSVVHNSEELRALINRELANGRNTFTFKTEGYIINSANQIGSYVNGRGFSGYQVSGDLGKEGAFCVFLN